MKGPLDRFRLWRRGKGFGIHSPWAYAVVMEALRQPREAAYYCYPSIDRCFGRCAPLARAVFRLLQLLRPRQVSVVGDAMWTALAVTAGAEGHGGKAAIVNIPARFEGWGSNEVLIFTCLDTPQGMDAWQRALNSAVCSAVQTTGALGVASRRHGLPRQLIEVSVSGL